VAEGFKIEIKGIPELQNQFRQIAKDIENITADAVMEGGEIVREAAKTKVHVITSRLRESIDILHVNKTENRVEVQVGSDVPYAEVEEFRIGGKYPGSHSYLRWALDNNEQKVVSTIEKSIESALSRYK
jgi:HK97 gp10 family phage protein